MAVVNGKQILKTLKDEYLKRYFIYDVDGYPTHIYEATPETENGKPCLLTRQEWTGGKLIKSREEESTWSSAYDIT